MIPIVLAATVITGGCAGADGTERGAIRENVIEPGITAINQANVLACSADLSTLRTALDTYQLLEGEPAPSEAALVESEFLRSESELWDVRDGAIVAVDPACGTPPPDDPSAADPDAIDPDAIDIVTSTEPPPTADELLTDLSPSQVEAVGGSDCARELVTIFAAVNLFLTENGRGPNDLLELETSGALTDTITLWQVVDDELVPTADSACEPLSE
jgi:hypothetical protein